MPSELFRRRLEARLANHVAAVENAGDYFSAAVVVPLVEQDGEPALLFEVRSSQLAWQPGEICFPGGRIEPEDADAEAAAVRETYEELRLRQGELTIVGPQDYVVSPIGVIVYPFVGYISGAARIRPNPEEVAEIFTVPLDFFIANDPVVATMEVATKPAAGFPLQLLPAGYPTGWRPRTAYPVLFYKYERYVIWGLTARIVNNFANVCREINRR